MTSDELRALLEGVRTGAVGVSDAAAKLGQASVAELSFATLDLDGLRTGGANRPAPAAAEASR